MIIDPLNRTFRRIPVGAELGGCVVTAWLNHEDHSALQLYRVRYLCCGLTRRMTHKNLVQRHSSGQRTCRGCASPEGRQSPPHLSAVRARALEMRRAGLSMAKIGKAIGISPWTVRTWAKNEGLCR